MRCSEPWYGLVSCDSDAGRTVRVHAWISLLDGLLDGLVGVHPMLFWKNKIFVDIFA